MRPEHHIKQFLLEKRHGVTRNYSIPQTTTHLRPTVVETFETPPLPTEASRVPSDKSPFNSRGTHQNRSTGRIMVLESALELKAGKILQHGRGVAELREQWPKVRYLDHDNVSREHTFDYWVRMHSGTRIAIAVKPFEKLVEQDLITTLLAIHDQGIGGLADRVNFITEYYASQYAAANAEEILFARQARNEADVEEARALLMEIRGDIRFGQLFAGLEAPCFRRAALWCLIDEGLLRPVAPSLIQDHTLMCVVRDMDWKQS